ncbi:MAG TPA: hypothetical protein H9902_05010, partial [Candidatus Stackebrandtia faecavium]|nr:hypothetical protein [Candidatus Stackebrandtia faecavium]
SNRWSTVPTRRTVLFVARTMQATSRLIYDVLPLIWEDSRVQAVFTVDATSHFGEGLQNFLEAHKLPVLEWEYVIDHPDRFDLTVSASANNLSPLPTPLLTMSHGAGHHKYRVTEDGIDETVSGLSPQQLLTDDGRPIPTRIALGGEEQRRRLSVQVPSMAPRATVTGDVCLERLQRSRSQRFRYRRHLGIDPSQRLIFLSSTWGPDALLARRHDLAAELLSHLPSDEFRVIAAWHPNSWQRHGHANIAGWAGPALRAGLMLIPPHEGWRAGLVASDCVISDHGSVGFYAAAIGKPIVFVGDSDSETPADSPAAALMGAAPRIADAANMASQLRLLTSRPAPDYSSITDQALTQSASASENLRALMYELLGLTQSFDPAHLTPVPLPIVDTVANPAHNVYINDASEELVVERFPASDMTHPQESSYAIRVFVVDSVETSHRRRCAASAMVWTESTLDRMEADAWSKEVFSELPGLRLTAAKLTDTEIHIRMRDGDTYIAAPAPTHHLATVAAVVHTELLKGNKAGTIRYRAGNQVQRFQLRSDTGSP